jgi:acetaldehyde dehydrogenase (acetylating)
MALYKISSSRVNNIQADQYTGSVVEEGLIWYDPEQGTLRLYNGTQGGLIINGGGGGSPGGTNTQVQFNNNGVFGGSANLTFNSVTGTLSTAAVAATGNISAQYFIGNGSLLTGINTGPGTELVNGNSNVRVYPNGPVAISVNGVSNVAVFEGPQAQFDAVYSAGNITTDAYFIGDGSKLTGITANYSNANVAAYLPTYSGDFSANTVNATANVSANYFIGNGAFLTGISASSDYSNANVAAYLPTYTGNLTSLTGPVTTTANITGEYFIGNGSQLTGLPEQYSNANVAAYLPTYTGNLTSLTGQVTTTGNITGNYILGNGSQLSGLPEGYSNLAVSTYLASGTNDANIITTANITGAYFIGNGSQLTGLPEQYSNANVAAYLPTYTGNLVSLTGDVTTTANISGNYIFGNGSQLTGLPEQYSNANVAAYLPTYTGNLTSLTGPVTTAANVTANYFIGNGSQLTGLPEQYSNANVAAYLPTYTGNLAGSDIFVTGNAAVGNLQSAGSVDAIGNISANYFIGNGALLTGISASGDYSNANVAAYLPTYTGNLASLQGPVTTTANITGEYFIGNGSQLTGIVATDIGILPSLTVTGNIISGNINTAGNVTAEFFIGDGSKLTGITAQGLPTQAGNAGLFLSTDGANVIWNGALGGSLTFNGGVSDSDEFGSDLDGGDASDDFVGATSVLGGFANSDYSLTLSSVALTGQAQDVIVSPPPLTSTSAGSKGQIAFDSNWLYICVAANTWKQVALSSW